MKLTALTGPISILGLLLIFTAGCRPAAVSPTTPAAVSGAAQAAVPTATMPPTATATPSPTATATPSPTATQTPTPTPTPTATAVPVRISGDPRAAVLAEPEAGYNAPCGIVDILDFPMNPPDAAGSSNVGQGFGRFRSRYDQYHAGEDWWGGSRGSAFGRPVYSIGHGEVSYANPNGWGRDKGVVIIRHRFADGSTILSFYGHLDPPSVTLRAGQCVTRGEQVGQVGQPRTPPHLHFEMRSHMPDEPGPGYWPVDPTGAGWVWPTQFIWRQRMESSPGVQWLLPLAEPVSQFVGSLADGTAVIINDGELLGIEPELGRIIWRYQPEFPPLNGTLDQEQPLVYLAYRTGEIEALRLPEGEDAAALDQPAWTLDTGASGIPNLMPMPGGGLAAAFRTRLYGIDAEGDVLWGTPVQGRQTTNWVAAGGYLIYATGPTEAAVYAADPSGARRFDTELTGQLSALGDQPYLHGASGLYRLSLAEMSASLDYLLPTAYQLASSAGDAGGARQPQMLLFHDEGRDRRLVSVGSGGQILWDLSVKNAGSGAVQLAQFGGRAYLLLSDYQEGITRFQLFRVDPESGDLQRIISAGSAVVSSSGLRLAYGGGDRLLMLIDGQGVLSIDVAQAEAQLAASGSD